MERSFVEVWSLSFDDVGLVEGINRSGQIWLAFQLCFFRAWARFPSRSGDVHADVLRYLSKQLGVAAPEARDFEYGHVTARRHRAAILRYLDIRRATDRDRRAFRNELTFVIRGSFGENRIRVTPFAPVPEPPGPGALKREVDRVWPMTVLLDVLKETALDTRFLDCFETSDCREALAQADRDRRLLPALYAAGTNARIKRVAAGVGDISCDELRHIHRRYIDLI